MSGDLNRGASADEAALTELRSAELRAERLSAGIRAVVFLALLAVFASIDISHEHDTYVTLSVAIYGVVAAVAAILAWRRLFHPALAYALVTIDVVLVAVQLILLVRVFRLPHALLIRYRRPD